MEQYIEQGDAYGQTRRLKNILGLRVLSKSGDVLGRVVEVRMDHKRESFEGVLVRMRNLKKVYVNKTYVQKITDEAVLLSITPAIVYKGRKVVSSDGKAFGKAIEVRREGTTNNIEAIIVQRHFVRRVAVPIKDFSKLGASLILKKTYSDAKKEYNA